MAEIRWIDVSVEVKNKPRSILAQVYGEVPTTIGKRREYDKFTAIRLYGAQPTGDDPWNAKQAALLLTVDSNDSLDGTSIYPRQGADKDVWLEWDGERLRFIFSGDKLDEAINIELWVRSPLAPNNNHQVVELAFRIPFPYLSPFPGRKLYMAAFRVDGYKATATGFEDAEDVHPLEVIFENWRGEAELGRWPLVLDPAHSNLVASPVANHVGFTRLLSFDRETQIEDDAIYRAKLQIGSKEWHTPNTPNPPPALWPFQLVPRAETPRDDLTCVEHVVPWATGRRAPEPTWHLATEWTPGPKRTPAGVWNQLIKTHFSSLNTVWAQTGGSVLPVLGEAAKQHWRTIYRVRRPSTKYDVDRPRLGPATAFEASASLKGLRSHDGEPLERTFKLIPLNRAASVHDDDAPDGDNPRFHHIAFDVVDRTAKESPANKLVRIGALDLGFAPAPLPPKPEDPEVFEAGTYMLSGKLEPTGIIEPPRVCAIKVPLALGRVIPADQDVTEAEAGTARTGSVLVFDPALTKSPQVNKTTHWVLVANERTASNHDHSFSFMFQPFVQQPVASDRRTLIVLADTPFLVAQVEFDPSLLQSGVFGRASLEGPAWQLVDGDAPAKIRLPPQILGEEMIKDYANAPYTPDPAKPLRYKLSRTAALAVDRRVLATSAAEPAWNLQRLFGWPRRTVPGSRLASLTMELLYGLEATLDAPGLRVLEMFASIGELRAKKDARGRGGNAKFLKDDGRARAQLASRLMYLYVAADRQPYPPALIEDGVKYRFRPERQVAHPIDPTREGKHGDDTTWIPPEKGGLAGGVDWGFESNNTYEEALDSPSSTSGRLAAPALTTLGGFGFQKAGFANNKSRIYSDAALGRTTYYALERIGRIGVLWHPAKHVIVYERTVAASKQFPEQGLTHAWRGRPVVRKVREYVELLEDKRSYPDDDSPKATRGAMLAAAFLDRIIPVDSKWGRDIPGGWIVPLHREGADANVYKVPRIQLHLATSAEPVWKPHDEPHKLVFYTSTDRAHDANPSSWPPVPGVDFPYATIPTVDKLERREDGDEARAPDAPSIEAAYEQFTYRLGGIPSAIDIAAERGRSAIEAKLQNITLARRSLVEMPDNPAARSWEDWRGALDEYHGAVRDVAEQLRKKLIDLDAFATHVTTARDTAKEKLRHAGDVVDELVRRQTDYLSSWPRDFNEVMQAAKLRIDELVAQRAERELAAVFNDLGRRLSSVQLIATELDGRFRAAIRSYQQTTEQLAPMIVDLEHRLHDLAGKPELAKREALQAIVRMTSRVQQAVEAAGQLGAAAARRALTQFLDDVRARIAETNLDTGKLIAHATALRDALGDAGVAKQISDLAGRLPTGKAEEIEHALADFLALQQNALARRALADLAKFRRELDKIVGDAQTAVRNVIDTANTALAKLKTQIAGVVGQVNAIDDTVKAELDAWIALAKQVKTSMESEFDSMLANVGERAREQLGQQRAFVEQTIHRFAEQVAGDVSKLGDRAMRLVRAWGETPVASGLAYTRDRVAYFFHDRVGDALAVLPNVNLTPVTALVNRLERDIPGLDLHTIGMRLPTFALSERLIPDLTKAIDLSKLFPDIAGLKLDGLFSGVKLPTVEEKGLQIKHGFDHARRTAWVRTDIDVRIPPANIFTLGPFAMKLLEARFFAHTEVSADPVGGVRRTTTATVSGEWRFEIGGQLVAALENTKLELDDAGKLHFDIKPTSIRVADALRMLTQLLAFAPSTSGSGLSIGPIFEGSLPVGVRVALNLALPSLQSGAFSISNLSLATHFQIAAATSGFELSTGLGFATPDRPFNLSVLFLGGGGWFTTAVRWTFGSSPVVDVDLGIAAGASLPFDIGIAKGGVWLLLSVGVRWRSGGPFSIVLAISLRGEVVILSIVSVSLYLRLEARYISGGAGLQCSGYLSLTIKIGWFFKIHVSHHVTFTLAGGGGGGAKARSDSSLDDHVSSYEPDHA